jgi:broad specificity phosphatase PhoE
MTVVHLLRHGEVYNPRGILYGRSPGFVLSDRGRAMAERVAERIGHRDITHIVSSPLERAQETAAPLAKVRGIVPVLDERVVESTNVFEGRPFTIRNGLVMRPSVWRHLWNPFRPSWGEPYADIAARMWAAVEDARDAAEGHEAVIVSHQLPIWICRLHAEGRRFLHDPRHRQCTLCSVTSLEFDGDRLLTIGYSEPAGDLIPAAQRNAAFSAGTGFQEPNDLAEQPGSQPQARGSEATDRDPDLEPDPDVD